MLRGYSDGETFPHGGTQMTLRVEPGAAGARVSVTGREVIVRAPDSDGVRKFILYWLTGETEEIARALVPEWCKKLSVRPRAVAVGYAKTRWGSCSSSGRIFLNSRLAMLSRDVAEYVIVHELCHLKQMNHGREFWEEVKKAIPTAMSLRRSLRAQERDAVLP